ncbi:hypothetical protein [Deinococcus rubellus]|uniref:Uncharacterized protein n=1 Tax=Deinococcus rubellus TaxID=1889240 RepID=A0ABY5YGG5_9DEIO|nr:hypothetical protein [Deinococcus rubellus]UWX64170.1 hypothetical protein N0D28_00365 [Deinococcus rubellus]
MTLRELLDAASIRRRALALPAERYPRPTPSQPSAMQLERWRL